MSWEFYWRIFMEAVRLYSISCAVFIALGLVFVLIDHAFKLFPSCEGPSAPCATDNQTTATKETN